MKKYHLFLLWMAWGFANGQTTSHPTADDFKKLKWIEGTWKRTNNKQGQLTMERWVESSPYELQGTGITLQGADTLFVEKLRIVILDDVLYYVADVPENRQPIYFKFEEITDGRFSCENPDHDFPKKIMYERNGDNLHAVISGNGKSIDYMFKKE